MDKDFLIKTLKEYGLSENEALVYLEAIKSIQTSPYALSKSTGIPRTTVYDIVMSLSLKGLMKIKQSNGIEKQQTIIQAENPGKLREMIIKKREDLSKFEMDIVNAIAVMKSDYFKAPKRNQTFVKVFNGYEEFVKIYYKTDRSSTTLECFAWDSWLPQDTHGKEIMNDDVDQTVIESKKYGIKRKEIVHVNTRAKNGIIYQFERNPEYFDYVENRYIESPSFNLYNRIEVKGSFVYTFSNEREEIYGIIIQSQNYADSLRSIFLEQWKTAKPLTSDVINHWKQSKL